MFEEKISEFCHRYTLLSICCWYTISLWSVWPQKNLPGNYRPAWFDYKRIIPIKAMISAAVSMMCSFSTSCLRTLCSEIDSSAAKATKATIDQMLMLDNIFIIFFLLSMCFVYHAASQWFSGAKYSAENTRHPDKQESSYFWALRTIFF